MQPASVENVVDAAAEGLPANVVQIISAKSLESKKFKESATEAHKTERYSYSQRSEINFKKNRFTKEGGPLNYSSVGLVWYVDTIRIQYFCRPHVFFFFTNLFEESPIALMFAVVVTSTPSPIAGAVMKTKRNILSFSCVCMESFTCVSGAEVEIV